MNTVLCVAAVTAFSPTAHAAGERAHGSRGSTPLARTASDDRALAAALDTTTNVAWMRGWRLAGFDEVGTSLADADGFAARSSAYVDLAGPPDVVRGSYIDTTVVGDTPAVALA